MPAIATENPAISDFLMSKRQNHCPFGCQLDTLDMNGYCYHLVGFSNDKRTLEPVRNLIRKGPEGPYDTGLKIVLGGKKTQPVQPTDKLINPERPQTIEGVTHMAKAWVSDRVYRDVPKPAERAPLMSSDPLDDELHAMMQKKKDLDEKLKRKKLAEEIAALEEELTARRSDKGEQP